MTKLWLSLKFTVELLTLNLALNPKPWIFFGVIDMNPNILGRGPLKAPWGRGNSVGGDDKRTTFLPASDPNRGNGGT